MHPQFHRDAHRARGNRHPVVPLDRAHHGPCCGRRDRHGYPTQRPCVAFGLAREPLPYPPGMDDGYLDAVRPFHDPDPALGEGYLERRGLSDHHARLVHRVRLDVELGARHLY